MSAPRDRRQVGEGSGVMSSTDLRVCTRPEGRPALLMAGVRESAGQLAVLKLAASGAVDGFGCTAGEAALWLHFIPLQRPESPEQMRCVARSKSTCVRPAQCIAGR